MPRDSGTTRKSEKVKPCPVCHSDFLIVTSKNVYIKILKEDHKFCCLISCGKCCRIKGVIQDEFETYRKLRKQALQEWGSFSINGMAHK